MVLIEKFGKGYEAYAQFDESAQVFEIFTDTEGEGYIGCADTMVECLQVAREWYAEATNY
jgi:hypothetical protein